MGCGRAWVRHLRHARRRKMWRKAADGSAFTEIVWILPSPDAVFRHFELRVQIRHKCRS